MNIKKNMATAGILLGFASQIIAGTVTTGEQGCDQQFHNDKKKFIKCMMDRAQLCAATKGDSCAQITALLPPPYYACKMQAEFCPGLSAYSQFCNTDETHWQSINYSCEG